MDIISYAQAKRSTAKVINLNNYKILGVTYSEMLLRLLSKGGGIMNLPHYAELWDELEADRPNRLLIDLDSINVSGYSGKLLVDVTYISRKTDGMVDAFGGSFVYELDGSWMRIEFGFRWNPLDIACDILCQTVTSLDPPIINPKE